MRLSEPAPAKLNLALHVRGKLPDGRHELETLFAFCVEGDRLEAEVSGSLSLDVQGLFASALSAGDDNLVLRAARALAEAAGTEPNAKLVLTKKLPVAAGIGGGSADAAATLRLLTRLWNIDPSFAVDIAPTIGSDVPACLLSLTARGSEAGDKLELIPDPSISGTPVLLANPGIKLSTPEVFAVWDGIDRGPLGAWREGRNDLEKPAIALVPEIDEVLDWLRAREGANFVRMSGSGATCFALFDSEEARDEAAANCTSRWWHLATFLR